ncbi:MAG: acyl carrier protein [Acetobacteraceae bacterium]
MDEAELLHTLSAIVAEACGHDRLTLTRASTAAEVKGWDSLRMVMIIVAVEERFGIKMRTREIDRLKSVGDFVDLIRGRMAAAKG